MDEDRLFHLTAVVGQNGFQLSTLAMSDRLFALRLFARVARKGSFSAAGRELNIPQSTASRTIATLEREIGVALFVRTTRAVTLTDAGLDFLARIESVLAELDEAEHAARGTGELRGILRIGLATNFAVREVIPRLSDFMSRHPALRIDLMMGDQREDLGQVDDRGKLGRYRSGRRRLGHRHDSARRVSSRIRERRARSATGMGRGIGRAQRRLCERQSRQAISASLCRLLDRSASPVG